MNSIKQLIRHPFKTICGILLVTAAVAVLCICLGQSMAASNLEENMDDLFTSVALITDKHQFSSEFDYENNISYEHIEYSLPEDVAEWIETTAQQNPDIVESIHRAGLASAYIPELAADNKVQHLSYDTSDNSYLNHISATFYDHVHTHIMAKIQLTEVGDMYEYDDGRVAQQLKGTIEQVLGLHEGYNDPTDFNASMTLILPNRAALQALNLKVGENYLVNGTNYTDMDWTLRVLIGVYGHGVENSWQGNETVIPPQINAFIPENLVMLSQKNIDAYSNHGQNDVYQVAYYLHDEVKEDGSIIQRCINLTNLDMENYRSVYFVMNDRGTAPTIAHLDGAAEDFLSSQDGELWQEYLSYYPINNHAFPVVGVDNLMGVGDFVLGNTLITQGRNFKTEELINGEKVCIISEQLATINGLSVGDSITPQFYSIDYNDPNQNFVSEGIGVIDPCAYSFGPNTEFQSTQTYRIIGLYNNDVLWQGASSMYEFTCNTIFAPKASISADMDYGDLGIFQSLIIKNGMLDEFEELAIRDGHDGLFRITDQGYEDVKNNLHNYQEVANQAMVIGTAVYCLILVLYLILYPGSHGKSLKIMASMGAVASEKLKHLLVSSLGILIPGSLMGLLMGCLLWDQVVNFLMQRSDAVMSLELNISNMLGITLLQFIFAFVLTVLLCLPKLHTGGLMGGRKRLRISLAGLMRSRQNWPLILLFAAVVSLVLCGLHRSNQSEQESYERSYQETPVKVSLVTLQNHDPYNLNADAFIRNLFADERFARYTPQKYLKDIQLISDVTTYSINEETSDVITFYGLRSDTIPEELHINWFDGFDPSMLDARERILIVPESWVLTDCNKAMDGIQLGVTFHEEKFELIGEDNFYITTTVAGTHDQGEKIYTSRDWLGVCSQAIGEKLFINKLNGVFHTYDSQTEQVIGITSKAEPLNLSAQKQCQITWLDGYSADCMNGEDMMLLVPEEREFKDMEPDTPGTQIIVRFSQQFSDGRASDGSTRYRLQTYGAVGTVAGTYTNSVSSWDIYCSYWALEKAAARAGYTLGLDYISATMIDNDQIADLRTMADQWFADPNKEMDNTQKFRYALNIDTSSLDNLKATLENSMLINNLCTLLVFLLTAGAGFFLGFLMVRSRKREIILMRTLGKPNSHIYRDFALEQMLWVLIGILVGGAVFLWKPLSRLALFALIYFLGLSAALLVFLRSTLLTTIKEDE